MNFFINRLIINEVTDLLKPKCLDKIFHFINQNNGWTLNNSTLNFSLFFSDILHSVKKGNLKLVKSILKAFDSNSNANPYKNAVCFNLNECGFPPLPSPATTSQPLHFPAKCVGPVLKLSYPVRIATATFVSHISNICYTNASIQSFSSKLKTTSSLNFALSFHQKYATRSPYSSDPVCVSSSPVTTLSVSSQTNSDRADSVPPSVLPSNVVVSSVNSLNSFYVARTKPFFFQATKPLVPKSLPPFKTWVCINSSVSGTVSNGEVSHSANTSQSCVALVQHTDSNFKQVADLDSFNSRNIYLSSLSKLSSFVTTKCSPTFLSLLVSFLALCYSSKLLSIFYLVFLTFLTRCFFITQSNCLILRLNMLPCF